MRDCRAPLKLRVKRKGWRRDVSLYLKSPFHTLLHMPQLRFVAFFFVAYLCHFSAFACGYLWFSDQCVDGIERFPHAFFFSVQTSATIGAAPCSHDCGS